MRGWSLLFEPRLLIPLPRIDHSSRDSLADAECNNLLRCEGQPLSKPGPFGGNSDHYRPCAASGRTPGCSEAAVEDCFCGPAGRPKPRQT